MRTDDQPSRRLADAARLRLARLLPRISTGALTRLAPLVVVVALALIVIAAGAHHVLSVETLVRNRAGLNALIDTHYVLALSGFVAIYTAVVALSVPGAVFLTIAGGALFGWLAGGVTAIVGATFGATLLFLIVRFALGDFLRRRLGSRLAAIAAGFRADAFSYLLFLRLVPIFPFWLVNLAPALAGVALPTFVAATALGVIPGTFAFAIFGSGLDSVIAAQETAYDACVAAARADCRLDLNVRAALTPQLFAGLTALGLTALIPTLVKRWRARRKAGTPPA
ncbi:MAG TPA: TVP38/TMEM64 family protein [Xanthobacteraceae bacterium]|nr:TVP38/TMEM64 family protein [Xanthobacteraceae bacterium]